MGVGRHILRNLARGLRSYWEGNNLSAFPFRRTFQEYPQGALRDDLRAGVNVALLAFPQGMAYAVIAEIPIAYGITCSAVAALFGPLLCASRHTILGPTNATAFMLFSSFAALPGIPKLEMLPVLVLLVGLFLMIGAFFRMADLIQYVSRSVVVGYITGAAILIITNQLRHVFGVSPPAFEGSKNFFTILSGVLGEIGKIQWAPLLVAAFTYLVWFLLNRRFRALPTFAIALVLGSVFAVLLARWGHPVPSFEAYQVSDLLPAYPDLSREGFFSDVSQLFGLAFAVAFLASLENSVMAKTLASLSGDRSNGNQDMLGVGAANVAAAFLSGMPASGSLTRSALNFASGARSGLSSIVCALLCVAGAFTLAPAINYVPKAALAALVIGIAGSLINRKNLRICLTATRSDASTVILTLLATLLLPLHVAIFVGVGISVALYLRKASRPELIEYEFADDGNLRAAEGGEERQNPSISIVHVEGALFFGAAELFRTQIQRIAKDPNLKVIVLRMKNAHHLDATSVLALSDLIKFLRSRDSHLIISGAMKDVYRVLKNSGLVSLLGRENIFMGSTVNPNISTRNALKRAQEILGTKEAEVKIFYDPSHPRDA